MSDSTSQENSPAPAPDERFVAALTENQSALEAYCRAKLGDREKAREVLQRTNLKLWQKADHWDPETRFLPWAFTVARFTVLSYLRDKSRERLIFDPDLVEAMAGDAEVVADSLDARRSALRVCMAKVKEEPRQVLTSHYVLGHSVKEIAAATGRSVSGVKVMMMRLRRQLAGCIEAEIAREARL